MILFLVVVADLYLLVMAIVACRARCLTRRRRSHNLGSSDEEDDAEFLRAIAADQRQGVIRARPGQGNTIADVMGVQNINSGDLLMNHIRNIIDTTSHRRNLLG